MTPQRFPSILAAVIVRGFVVVLPVLLLGLVIKMLFDIFAGWIHPLLDLMPGTVLKIEAVRFFLVLLMIAFVFLIVGLLAGTQCGQRIGRWIESPLTSHLPFYNALRTMVSGWMGRGDDGKIRPVLVSVDEPGLQQFGLLLDTHADGRCTVFLPSSPNPGSGTTVIATPDRISELDVPVRDVLRCLFRWGHDSGKLLSGTTGRPTEPLEDSP